MIMPHQSDEICEKLLAIKEILEDDTEIVHLPDQLAKIKEIFEEIEEIIELD